MADDDNQGLTPIDPPPTEGGVSSEKNRDLSWLKPLLEARSELNRYCKIHFVVKENWTWFCLDCQRFLCDLCLHIHVKYLTDRRIEVFRVKDNRDVIRVDEISQFLDVSSVLHMSTTSEVWFVYLEKWPYATTGRGLDGVCLACNFDIACHLGIDLKFTACSIACMAAVSTEDVERAKALSAAAANDSETSHDQNTNKLSAPGTFSQSPDNKGTPKRRKGSPDDLKDLIK